MVCMVIVWALICLIYGHIISVTVVSSVISVCVDIQYAVRVWHCINALKHIHVHTQLEAERWWYRWKWEVIEDTIYHQADD